MLYPLGYFDSEANAARFRRDLLASRAGLRPRPASNDPIYGEVFFKPIWS